MCLQEELKSRHVVLHLDVLSAHFHVSVLKACSAAGFHVHYIPACATSMLQSLDTSVFSKFKRRVSDEIERCRLASADGQLSRAQTGRVASRCGLRHPLAELVAGLRAVRLSSSLASRVCFDSLPAVGSEFPAFPICGRSSDEQAHPGRPPL